jgi:hypothetical protein
MKKMFTLLFLFVGMSIFAQTKQASVEDVMNAKHGAAIFERLINSTLPNIPEEKREMFKVKASQLVADKKAEAKKYFENKYSQKDINDIYAELTNEERFDYSLKTTGFIKEWRSYKAQYQSEFKELYNSL